MKVYIIGLDGADFKYINEFIKNDELPNLQKILLNGVSAPSYSTKPPITPIAWTSIFSGKNKDKHEIYDWTKFENDDYRTLKPYSSEDVKALRIWDYLSCLNIPAIVMNFPMTYPVQQIEGIFISGFETPINSDMYFYPENIKNEIEQKFGHYEIAVPYYVFTKDYNKFLNLSAELSFKHTDIFLYLSKKYDIKVNMLCYIITDQINHYFKGKREEHLKSILKAYRIVDECLGKILAEMKQEDALFVVSDHGSMIIEENIYLNKWLMDEKYLVFYDDKLPLKLINYIDNYIYYFFSFNIKKYVNKIWDFLPGILKKGLIKLLRRYTYLGYAYGLIDWDNTYAFVKSFYGQIYLNKDRVSEKKYKLLIKEIRDKLKKLRFKGKYVFNEIIVKENYSQKQEPDIIALQASETAHINNFNFKSISGVVEKNTQSYAGEHRQEGIFLAFGNKIKKNIKIPNISVLDIVPTVLKLLKINTQGINFDGRALDEIFTDKEKNDVNAVRISENIKTCKFITKQTEAADHSRELTEKLKNLGYLD